MLSHKLFLFFIILFLSQISFGQSDTLNQKDSVGQKQGYWIIYGIDKPEKAYCDTCKIEEGNYTNDRKNGEWIRYQIDGVTPRIIGTYVNGRPKGSFIKVPRYDDTCYKSGCPKSSLNFNESGKQHGINIYYYDCDFTTSIGKIEYKCKFDNGVKIDTAYRYYRNGDLKQTIIYNVDGTILSNVNYDRIYPEVELAFDEVIDSIGNCKRYRNDELFFWGECRDGKIWKGKKYIYDSDGILIRIEIWKARKYYSDAQL